MHFGAYVLNTLNAKNVNLKSIVSVHHVAFRVWSTNVNFFNKPETGDYFISENVLKKWCTEIMDFKLNSLK